MQLLVSVAGTAEARAALCGGADVIDAKDPRRGALGPVSPQRLRAIRTAIGSAPPLSAALGDAGDETAVAAAARATARVDVWFVKVGFAGVTTETRAQRLAVAARRGLTAATAHGARLVLVAYADWRRAESLSPSRLIAIAAAAGAAGILLDTAGKDAPLFRIEPPAVVGRWVAAAHAAGLFAALAGSLSGPDFGTAGALGADLVGVRGAACVGGRTGTVSRARVAALRALLGPAPAPHVPTGVLS